MNRIAVLLTCFNRRDVTKICLERLLELRRDVDVYCVDDKSTDGTFEMIRKFFPEVNLIIGTGNLFWSRGMRLAWEQALNSNKPYDYYFWLNDDLELYENAFAELLEGASLFDNNVVISGLVQETITKEPIYGGSFKGHIVRANGEFNPIDHMNGNFVVVPKKVVERIGILDPVYHHDLGDVDYGFVAKEAGIPVVSSRSYIGTTNGRLKSPHKRNRRYGTNIINRFKVLYSPLGSNPKITFHFMKKHKGRLAASAYFCYVHFINVLPDAIYKIIWK